MLTFEIFSLDDNYLDWMITTQLDDNYVVTLMYGFIGIEGNFVYMVDDVS